ncbi:MAG TPA: hypothetical protein DIU15_11980, partial [Deltaproteobacteria bacterium]|nr:hypothetical protein [Deltaproteobacteria bacterium]
MPQTVSNDTYYTDTQAEDWDEEDLSSDRRRTNQLMIAGAAVAAILAIGLFGLIWILNNAKSTTDQPIAEPSPPATDPL